MYTGCNIENASYGASNCAERTAFFKAVSEGYLDFRAIAIAGGPEEADGAGLLNPCPPCGICRQVMREFCGNDFRVLLVRSTDAYTEYRLADLLPESFGPGSLQR